MVSKSRAIPGNVIFYWKAMANVRWAVNALRQTAHHLSGREPDLELAPIGRRLPELEYEVLALVAGM